MASVHAFPPSAVAACSSAVAPRVASACPPEARPDGTPAAPDVVRLKRRREFVRAARGRRFVTPAFVLQVHPRDDGAIGVGFTASRRVGNAVRRNRARRRLKEIARLHLPAHGLAGHDHVLVARTVAVDRRFDRMVAEFLDALAKARRPAREPRR